ALEIARAIGLPVEVRQVQRREALSADEMWLSSSTREVLAVTKVDGAPFGGGAPGPLFRAVWQASDERKPHPVAAGGRKGSARAFGKGGAREAALVEDQRLTTRSLDGDDLADENDVVPSGVPAVMAALEP